MELKTGLLWAGIGALSLSAVVAVSIFLFGTFGELEIKLLLTTFIIGWYSLASALVFGFPDGKFMFVTGAGVLASLLGALVALHLIWWDPVLRRGDLGELKMALVLLTVSFSLAHSSLLLKSFSTNVWQNGIICATVGFILVVSGMIIELILSEARDHSDLYYRFLAAAVVLSALGTALVPIVKKLVTSRTVAKTQ